MNGRFLFGENVANRVENRQTLPLEDKGFVVERGWHERLARELVAHSKEDEIRLMTPRDMTERFADEVAAERWYKSREHVVYALGHTASLDGVVWLSREPRPDLDADYTLAIRLYEQARGHGLAGVFLEAALKDFAQFKKYEDDYWLSTDEANLRAQRLYMRHGFEPVGEEGDRIVMVRHGNERR